MKYARIIAEVLSTPWAIREEYYGIIAEVLARAESGVRLSEEEVREAVGERKHTATPYFVAAGEDGKFQAVLSTADAKAPAGGGSRKMVAVIPVHGVIMPKASDFDISTGGTSIQTLTKQFRDAVANPDVASIVLDFDSPGGSVYGVDELAGEILAARATKKVVAQVNPLAASAAYYLASQASEIAITPSGEAGSIGVRSMHQDLSKALEIKGVKVTHISAGKYKTEGNPTEPLSEEGQAHMQARVNDYYDMFIKAVAAGREMSAKDVRGGMGEGRVVGAQDAKRMGMVDRIATFDETLARLTNRGAKAAVAASSEVPAPVAAQAEIPASAGNTASAENAEVKSMSTTATPATVAAAIPDGGLSMANILAIAKHSGMTDMVMGLVIEGKKPEEIQKVMLDKLASKAAPVPQSSDLYLAPDLSAADKKRYSLCRAIALAGNRRGLGMVSKEAEREAGFEAEVSTYIAKKLDKEPSGIYVPTNLSMAPGSLRGEIALAQARSIGAVTSSDGASAGSSVQTTVVAEEFIPYLRNLMAVKRLGARVLGGLQGNIDVPKQTGTGTLSWVGENPTNAVAASDLVVGSRKFSPRTALAQMLYSRQLVIQSSLDVEALVREDLGAIVAQGLDAAAIKGTGEQNQPVGVLNFSGITKGSCGTNGGAITYALLTKSLFQKIEEKNIPLTSLGVLTTPGVKYALKNVAKLSNTIAMPIWGDDDTVGGWPGVSTNQMPSNLKKGSSTTGVLHALIAGAWNNVMIGEWGAMEITVDPYTKAGQNNIVITVGIMADINVRYEEAFAVLVDIDPTA